MAEKITMPKMSDTMTEGVIASWLKKVGDKVKSGEVLAEVETDKATMELESYQDGVLLYIGVPEKSAVPVDGLIAIIGKEGEAFEHLLAGNTSSGATNPPKQIQVEQATPVVSNASAPLVVSAATTSAQVIRMPKMSDTMTEGVIVAWHKQVGDNVKSGDLLAEVETDKATMELESYENGTLLHIGIPAGKAAQVDEIIAIIGAKGTDIASLLQAQPAQPSTQHSMAEAVKELPNVAGAESLPQHAQNGEIAIGERRKISPLARRLATEKGIDLSMLKGTGEFGRIVKRDVDAFVYPAAQIERSTVETSKAQTPAVAQGEAYTDIPLSQMRKTIARRLGESKFSAPHFYLTMEIDMDNAIETRKKVNELSPVKVSFNDIVLRAAAAALKQHPKVNASWLGDKIRMHHHIHIGVAVAVEEGLLVPVVRHADQKSLSQIAQEVKDYGAKAKNKQLQPTDWEGNTFTISNLGMFGIEEFTAIINTPDVCILAVGAIREVPVVKNGQIVPGNTMKVTLSCDHRAVDGAIGSAFLQTLKSMLEDPIRILI
jgi:pyruvate dehydrogenase E2 component (dihydrolipoamide acetyltransferase)